MSKPQAEAAVAGQGGKTAITWTMRFESVAVRDKLAPVVVPANEQNFDRLQAELRAMV